MACAGLVPRERVQRVGLSTTHYCRISTDLVTRCVRARLEQVELKIVRTAIETAAKRPVEQLTSFLSDVLAGVCSVAAVAGTTLNELRQTENRILGSVKRDCERREELLTRLTMMPTERNRLRAEEGVAPEEVVRRCQEVVEMFCEERGGVQGGLVEEVWQALGAEPGDMVSLTKVVLADVFSKEFLVEVDAAEDVVEVPVGFEKVFNIYPLAKGAENV